MPAYTRKATGKRLFVILAVFLSVTSLTASCGSNADGDLNAYCDVIAKNLDLGIPDTNLPIEELDLLITLAPSEIKKTATKIRNSSADVAEISALDQLFAATFDPEAIEAQNFFQTYNAQNCNIETEVVQDLVSEKQAETQNELELFLTSNYSEANWNDKTEAIVIFNGIEIIGLNGKLPLGSGFQEADALCQALSLWLYAVKEIEGTINIQVGENNVLERSSEKLSCSSEEIGLTD
jgi:hypothetical protein|tara:strand:+ start:368 stop:1078 length:711 start_codon:yes stop_codon:yes gene_type:complete